MRGLRCHCLIAAAALALMSAVPARAEVAAGGVPSKSSPEAAGTALTTIPLADAEMLFPLAVKTLPDGTKQLDIVSLPVPLGLAIIDLSRRVDSLEAELKALKEKAQ